MHSELKLCGKNGCRLLDGHKSKKHNPYPASAWDFMRKKDQASLTTNLGKRDSSKEKSKDQDKLDKAGYATPRGGAKGAYQNHVVRSNRVIIPYERKDVVPLEKFEDGYVFRLFPDQYFKSAGIPKDEFIASEATIKVGVNAFVLYGSHKIYNDFPPSAMDGWRPRRLFKENNDDKSKKEVLERRGNGIIDDGHYILRMPKLGKKEKRNVGPVQGIFAPEYANANINFLCRCVLAWLIVHTVGSPYTTSEAAHLKAILMASNLLEDETWELRGVLRRGLTACPLCTRFINYEELHKTLLLNDEDSLENAGKQVEGATRATVVNLFHIDPLRYDRLDHTPYSVAWGHAICNTKLGQRKCYSIDELREKGTKLGIIGEHGIETIGWLSPNWEMIRTAFGAVWIRISIDREQEHDDPGAVADKNLTHATAKI